MAEEKRSCLHCWWHYLKFCKKLLLLLIYLVIMFFFFASLLFFVFSFVLCLFLYHRGLCFSLFLLLVHLMRFVRLFNGIEEFFFSSRMKLAERERELLLNLREFACERDRELRWFYYIVFVVSLLLFAIENHKNLQLDRFFLVYVFCDGACPSHCYPSSLFDLLSMAECCRANKTNFFPYFQRFFHWVNLFKW